MRASVVVARGLSSCGSWALEHRLSSCGARALLLHDTWDLPGPGIEPLFPALAGGFLTTATREIPIYGSSLFPTPLKLMLKDIFNYSVLLNRIWYFIETIVLKEFKKIDIH